MNTVAISQSTVQALPNLTIERVTDSIKSCVVKATWKPLPGIPIDTTSEQHLSVASARRVGRTLACTSGALTVEVVDTDGKMWSHWSREDSRWHDEPTRYLVPLLAKPVCSTCGGNGEVGRVSPDLLIGHRGLTPLASALFRPCPDCSDGVPLGQVQLVVECAGHQFHRGTCSMCGELYETAPYGGLRCHRVVTTADLLEVHPVYNHDDDHLARWNEARCTSTGDGHEPPNR